VAAYFQSMDWSVQFDTLSAVVQEQMQAVLGETFIQQLCSTWAPVRHGLLFVISFLFEIRASGSSAVAPVSWEHESVTERCMLMAYHGRSAGP
jgi:hypothetical protein